MLNKGDEFRDWKGNLIKDGDLIVVVNKQTIDPEAMCWEQGPLLRVSEREGTFWIGETPETTIPMLDWMVFNDDVLVCIWLLSDHPCVMFPEKWTYSYVKRDYENALTARELGIQVIKFFLAATACSYVYKNINLVEGLPGVFQIRVPEPASVFAGDERFFQTFTDFKEACKVLLELGDFYEGKDIGKTLPVFQALNAEKNKSDLLREDLSVVHRYLDDVSIPREDESGSTYSVVGRIKQLEKKFWKKISDLETEYLTGKA